MKGIQLAILIASIIFVYSCSEDRFIAITNVKSSISIQSDKALRDFLTKNYRYPRPEMASEAIIYLGNHDFLNDEMIPHLSGFFSEIFHGSAQYSNQWKSLIYIQEEDIQGLLNIALENSPDILMKKLENTYSLNDFCWGAYFAYGKTKYLDILIKQLDFINDKISVEPYYIANTAKWSLSLYSKKHKKVRQYLLKVGKFNPDKRKIITEILLSSPEEIKNKMKLTIKEYYQKGIWTQEEIEAFEMEDKQAVLGLIGKAQ